MLLLRILLAALVLHLLAGDHLFSAVFAQAPDTSDEAPAESPEEQKERVTAERFLQLLKSRPRLGTALDKVYGYHVGRGSLNEFCDELRAEATKSNDGKLWMVLGMVEMQRGEDAGAAESLKKAEELLPEEPLASYYLGKTLVLMGEVDKAAEAMRRAVERKPARADMLAILQDLGRIFQRTGQGEEAVAVWGELEKSFPGDSQVQEEIARILAEEGVLEGAIERYTALATSSKDRFRQVEMSIRAAQLKAQLGKSDEALADFEAALGKVNPDSWLHRDIRRRIEEVFWSSGDIDGLVAYYTRWVEKHPDDVDAMMRTARFLAVQRRLPEAEEWFRKAIERAPSKTEGRLALVESLVAEQQFAKAAPEMEEIVKLEPDNPDYIVRWGELVLSDTGKPDTERKAAAVGIWKRLLTKGSDNAVTVALVADLMRSAGATDEAIAQYKKAVELAPGEPQYREYLGEYFHQLGRKEEAVAVWKELATGDRLTRDNLVRLSEVFSTFGYSEKALEVMAQACEMNPAFGQRARYAELLREAERYDESLAQLDLAEPLVEDAELAELLMQERIKNYQASGVLTERIDELQEAVEGEQKADAKAWRRLALLLEADRKFQGACDAAEKATSLDPGSSLMWETAATLQERSGQFGAAIESYRKLATLDRRYLSNYLTQIASLEMRLGNTEAALKTGEQLVASAPGNTEHYRFFADLCFQAGEEERGLDVLRRSMRSNPSDSEALIHLAKVLSEAFRTDEAIELYWRAFDVATDLDGKTAVITPLTELYLRTNRFETLTERLEATGREQNKPREGLLWVAAAHQAAGDLGTAKLMLEQLVREESRDTKLLEQLVALSRAEYDFESAAEYQKRLVAIAPSIEAEYALASILLEQGEIDQSEALWLKLAQRKSDSSSVLQAIGSLMAKEQYETAAAIVEKGVASEPDNWELLAQAMIVYLKAGRNDDAGRIAERVLAMNIDRGEPTEQYKKSLQQRTSQHSQQLYSRQQDLRSPMRQMQTAVQVRAILGHPDAEMYYGSQRSFTPTCFGDVEVIALLVPFVAGGEEFDAEAFVKQQTDEALANPSPEKLWRALMYASWQDPRLQYERTGSEVFNACVERLVEFEDPYAAALMISQFFGKRQIASTNPDAKPEPLTESELAQIKKWSQIAQKGNEFNEYNYYHIWVAGELARAGQVEEAEELVDSYIESVKDKPQAGIATLQALSVLLTAGGEEGKLDPKLVARCRTLFKSSLADTKASTSANSGYGSMYSHIISHLVQHGEWDEAMACVGEVIEWQAQQTAELRPSQRERIDTNPTPLYYYRSVGGNHEQVTISFPPPSSYFGSESIYIFYELFNSSKEDKQRLAKLKSQIEQWGAEPADDPYLRLARLLAKASFEHWNGNVRQAEATLATAAELQLGGQFVHLALARLYHERGATREALAVVEKLKPNNQGMLVERELAILQLVLQLGDLDRARQSAQKLFAMRLPSNTEFKLADLMYQLGMTELGDRMMGRISRRAGGQQDTLVQLMTRYAQAGKNKEAAEIARQVIRRTEPRTSNRSYNSSNMQHQQALQILAQAGELDKLIEQYEGLVERSPKSAKLSNQLASFYEAAGRRDDAARLQLKAAEALPSDPRNLLQAGKQLAQAGKHKEAAEKFIAALVKSPDLLNNEYYEMEESFTRGKSWGKLADAMIEAGLSKFSQNYRLSEIFSELVNQKEHAALNRLLKAGLKELPIEQLSQVFYSIAGNRFELDADVGELLVEKIESKNFTSGVRGSYNFVYSRSSGGQTTGFVNGMAHVLRQNSKIEERAIELVSKRLEGDEGHLIDRALLAMIYAQRKDAESVRRVMEPVTSKKKKDGEDVELIWSIASELTHRGGMPELACELLESVELSALGESQGSEFQYSALALLADAYQKAKRNSDARRILVEQMVNMKVDTRQNQFNPGYGDYRYINSQAQLAQTFLAMGYPAEAFIAYRNAFADENRLARAAQWSGSSIRQRDSLTAEIAKATTPKFILSMVETAIGAKPEGEEPSPEMVEMAAWLTSPEIKQVSLVDVRVTMPLEEFTLRIAEDKKLKAGLAAWLARNPIDPDEPPSSLKPLVTRLLISTAVEHTASTEATSKAIVKWAEANGGKSGDKPAEAEDEADDKQEDDSTTPQPLPEELLLGMAAVRMPSSVVGDAKLAELFEEVVAIAEELDQPALVGGLKCQLARRIAAENPERARALLMEVLDDVLPSDTTSETTPEPAVP